MKRNLGTTYDIHQTFLTFISRSWDRASFMDSFKYNQQDATLYNILYYFQCSTCFRRFSVYYQELKNCTHKIWYMPSLLAATASGSSKQGKFKFSRQIFINNSNTKFCGNSCSGSRAVACEQMDGRDEGSRLFCDFANAQKGGKNFNRQSLITYSLPLTYCALLKLCTWKKKKERNKEKLKK